jgi:hypothetical protein
MGPGRPALAQVSKAFRISFNQRVQEFASEFPVRDERVFHKGQARLEPRLRLCRVDEAALVLFHRHHESGDGLG